MKKSSSVSRGRPPLRWLRRFLTVTVVIAVALITVYCGLLLILRHRMRATLPQLDGTLHLTGLSGPVLVRRDGHGVPHITANTLEDLLMAQGYLTAQDRLWQMDMARRMSAGTCAEVMGSSCVAIDRTQRIFGFQKLADTMLAQASTEDRDRLQSYARGVNAYIADHTENLPAEFMLLHYRPAEWKPVDSLLIELSVAQMLDDHWRKLAARAALTARLGPELAADLFPNGSPHDILPGQLASAQTLQPEDLSTTTQTYSAGLSESSQSKVPSWLPVACAECMVGSNAWVVAGARTASGRPILANDMHLVHQIPNLWYANELRADTFHVTGISIPGVPFVAAGRNDNIAWGITAMYGTTQSLSPVEVNQHGEYRHDNRWVPLQHSREVIHVRAARDIVLDVARTESGPLITALLADRTTPVTLHWTLFESMHSLPLFELDAAVDWNSFREALRHWPAPSLNLVYADRRGHIGYQAVGSFPDTRIAAAHAAGESNVYVPFDALPSVYDPPSGVIVTANSRVIAQNTPYNLGRDWPPALRTERIEHLLVQNGPKLTQDQMSAIQNDVFSAFDQRIAQDVATAIDRCGVQDEQLQQAARLLGHWDGVVATSSSAAAIVAAIRAAFWPVLLKPRLGEQWKQYDPPEAMTALESMLRGRKDVWLPPGVSDWDHLLLRVVQQGLQDQHASKDLSTWRYGQRHVVQVVHPLYSLLPGMARWAGPTSKPQAGDLTTVKQVSRSFGPSQRFSVDWGDADHATETLVNGESGNPESPWYNDYWEAWYSGHPVLQSGPDTLTDHKLRLVP